MSTNLTPKYTIIPFKDKVRISDISLGERLGGLSMNSASLRRGQGSEVFKVDTQGMYLGNETFANAPFSVTMAGALVATSLTLTGGTIKFGKTSFSDSANAGYFISPLGIYFGDAGDTTLLKYTVASGALEFIGSNVTITAGSVAWVTVSGTTDAPDDNATLGATLGTDVKDSDANTPAENTVVNYKKFTAGENLVAGNVVGFVSTITDYYPQHDAYVNSLQPTTNYGSITDLIMEYLSSGIGIIAEFYVTWNLSTVPSSENILKAEIIFTSSGIDNANSANLQIVDSGASWDESTVTWNTKPAAGTQNLAVLGSEVEKSFANPGDVITYDVTQLVRQWKAGDITNNGLRVFPSSTNNGVYTFNSSEIGGTTILPILRITRLNTTDSKMYKSNCDDYNTARVSGIVAETINNGNQGNIQIQGVTDKLSGMDINKRVYLNNVDGGFVDSQSNLPKVIQIGRSLSATEMLINIKREDIFIQNTKRRAAAGTIGQFTATSRYYAPDDASYVIVDIQQTGGENIRQSIRANRDTDGPNVVNSNVLVSTGSSIDFQITWGSNYVEITADQDYTIIDIYFYS